MDIHEYQAKSILGNYEVGTPAGGLAYSPDQAVYQAHELGANVGFVKAQVHGERGKDGGVVICDNEQQL